MSLNEQWAWTQVEAMADGSLSPAEEERMRAAMQANAELRAAVRQASALRLELRKLKRTRVPQGLLSRLWAIPGDSKPTTRLFSPLFAPLWIGAAAAAVVAVSVALTTLRQPEISPLEQQRIAALRDFETAMTYLQRGAAVANFETHQAIAFGLRDAWNTSRSAIRQTTEVENGG